LHERGSDEGKCNMQAEGHTSTVVKYTETDLSNNLLYCYIMVRTCVTDAILGSHLGWHQFFRTHLLARNHAQPTQLPWA